MMTILENMAKAKNIVPIPSFRWECSWMEMAFPLHFHFFPEMQMNRTEIQEQLKDILLSTDQRNSDRIDSYNDASRLIADMGLTSVSMLYMVIAIEETFDIRFDNIGMTDLVTLGDVIDYIEKKLA